MTGSCKEKILFFVTASCTFTESTVPGAVHRKLVHQPRRQDQPRPPTQVHLLARICGERQRDLAQS